MSSNLKIKRICAWCGKVSLSPKNNNSSCSKQCANALIKRRSVTKQSKPTINSWRRRLMKSLLKESKTSHFSAQLPRLPIYLGVTRPTVYGYIKRGELKVTRLGFKYLLKKEDIDELFNNPTEFHTPTKEENPSSPTSPTPQPKPRKVSCKRIMDILGSQENNIPRTFNRGKTLLEQEARGCLLSLRKPRIPTLQNGIAHKKYRKKFGMTLSAIYTFVSKNAIPKKKERVSWCTIPRSMSI